MLDVGEYRFGADTGQLLLRTYRTGLGSRAGHDLVIEVTSWRGTATVGDEAAANSVALTVDVDSFRVREGRGGVKPLSEGDRAEIRSTIRDKILDSVRFPRIEFRSTRVTGSTSNIVVEGGLEVRGVTRPVVVHGI